MTRLPLLQVDAFTRTALSGNPCAVVFDADDLSEAQMLAIAKEMNLSETAFVRRSQIADFGARYFTPGGEIPMAGHPTIATVFALVDTGRLSLTQARTTISLELQVGPIPVEIYADAQGRPDQIVMSQKAPQYLSIHEADAVMPIFGLNADDVLAGAPIQTVSTGTPQLMIAVRDLDTLRRAKVNMAAYVDFHAHSDFFSSHLFVTQGLTSAGQTFARHFAVAPDVIEDPFTGSATGGMAAYLWHYNLIKTPRFIAEQGHWMGRPGEASVEIVGPPDAIETVKVGGPAVTVLRGELIL